MRHGTEHRTSASPATRWCATWTGASTAGVCERQCANEVHRYDADFEKDGGRREPSASTATAAWPCAPPGRLKIVKTDHTFRENGNWSGQAPSKRSTARRRAAGCSSPPWATPRRYPVYWDKLLLNASQVTNPSIDPLREPMETRTFLGQQARATSARDERRAASSRDLPPQLELDMPILFSAMSYGSISYNAHACPGPGRAKSWAPTTTPARAACTEDFYQYGATHHRAGGLRALRRAQGLPRAPARPSRSRWARAPSPASAATCPGQKIVGDVSRTRMIPEGTDAISPAPHHDIYSIEDLRQLVFSLKEATALRKARASSRWPRCTTWRPSPAALPAAARTSSPSTASGAAPARRPPASATTWASPSSWPWPRWTSGCGRRASATTCPWWWAAPSAPAPDVVKAIALGADAVYIGTGGAAGLGLPPVPQLPQRQVQLGHRHPAARPGRAPEPGDRRPSAW